MFINLYVKTCFPFSAWIGPKQTIQVTVLAQVPQNAEVGLTDKITLISNSLTVTSQAVFVRVITGGALQDPHRPYIHYTFGARCDGKTEAGTCSNGFWSLEITTQDSQTGILRIESEPIGLVVRTPYVAGTKEDVRATFTASCCQPRVTVTSYDVAKNPSTFTVDVRDVWLSSAGIAAVTLGVLLGVLLIIFIIAMLVWCCCRNRESRDLPVYRTDSRTSRRP